MECGEQNPTKEETQSMINVGPSIRVSSLAASSVVRESSLFSISSSITHNTCNVFCLQRCPREKRSSHWKHSPFSLLICISRSVSLLKGGAERRVGAIFVNATKGVGGCGLTNSKGHVARGIVGIVVTCVAACYPASWIDEKGFGHFDKSPTW